MINANRNLAAYEAFGVPVWPDVLADYAGPLAGFLTGLERCETPWLVTVPCDTPLFPLDLVERLAQAAQERDAEIAMAAAARKTASCTRSRCSACCAWSCWRAWSGSRRAAAARSMPGPRSTSTAIVPFDAPGDDPRAFFNANTLAELHQLEAACMKSIAQIAAQLQGYDPQALSAAAVNDFLARLVEPVAQIEEVGIFEALDRVLARDLVSPISVPPHDNSAMDGYAFDGAPTARAMPPLTLEVVGTALAGKAWHGSVGAGQCVKIMTGAIMPAGLDTVVPQEFVTQAGGEGRISSSTRAAAARRQPAPQGRGPARGQPALRRGRALTPAACGLVASLGIGTLSGACAGCGWPTFPPATRS